MTSTLLPYALADTVVMATSGVFVAMITTLPATYAAWAAHKSKQAAGKALHEVKENGGMSDPDPTLKDYIRHVGENTVIQGQRLERLEEKFDSYMRETSQILEQLVRKIDEE